MPSWNVHTAHVQRLLREEVPARLGIRDTNAFLFGNFVPDIYIGYMVPEPTGILPYALTHFADPGSIPIPREREFWDTYVEPALAPPADVPIGPAQIDVEEGVRISRAGGSFHLCASPKAHEAVAERLAAPGYRASDVVLGAWAHLLCDKVYNEATHAWLERYGVPVGERTRIRKQGDFDLYGRTLPITLSCEPTGRLMAQAADFPQYAIQETDLRRSIDVANGIVAENQEHHIKGKPSYSLFSEDFFREVSSRVDKLLLERLRAYARRLAP